MRLGRPQVGSAQSHWVNIHAPNPRTRVTEIENALRCSLKKHAIATARIKNGVISIAYSPMNQESSNRVCGVEGTKNLLLSGCSHPRCDFTISSMAEIIPKFRIQVRRV